MFKARSKPSSTTSSGTSPRSLFGIRKRIYSGGSHGRHAAELGLASQVAQGVPSHSPSGSRSAWRFRLQSVLFNPKATDRSNQCSTDLDRMSQLRKRLILGALLLGSFAPSGARALEVATPEVSAFVGGNLGPGWWTVDIDPKRAIKVKSLSDRDGRNPSRQLTTEEQETLSRLISALPTKRLHYNFGTYVVIDATVEFSLTVGTGKEARRYTILDPCEKGVVRSEVEPVLQVLTFLRGLVSSEKAHKVPVGDCNGRKQ